MTITAKEEKKVTEDIKTYLQRYEEHVHGYKRYKMENSKGNNPTAASIHVKSQRSPVSS